MIHSCAPTTLRSKFSAAVNDAGDSLQIVAVDDPDLDEARFAGDRIYQFREIPAGTYPALEAGRKWRDLKTLTVGATLFVSQRRAGEHYDAHSYFVDAILRAESAILERVAPKSPRALRGTSAWTAGENSSIFVL